MVDFTSAGFPYNARASADRGRLVAVRYRHSDLKEKRRWRVLLASTFPIRSGCRSPSPISMGSAAPRPKQICAKLGIPPQRRVHELTDDEVLRIRELIDREYHGRRRSAPRRGDEHQAADGSRLLSRPAPPQGPAGARPAHAHQCAHPQGSGEADRRQEESGRSSREGRDRRHGRSLLQRRVCAAASARTSRPASRM